MGLFPDTLNRGLRMRRECRERFPRHRFQRKPVGSGPGMHHGTCVTHVPWCMSGSLNRGGGGKRSPHSRRMRNSQFYVSGKRPMSTMGNDGALIRAVWLLDTIVCDWVPQNADQSCRCLGFRGVIYFSYCLFIFYSFWYFVDLFCPNTIR